MKIIPSNYAFVFKQQGNSKTVGTTPACKVPSKHPVLLATSLFELLNSVAKGSPQVLHSFELDNLNRDLRFDCAFAEVVENNMDEIEHEKVSFDLLFPETFLKNPDKILSDHDKYRLITLNLSDTDQSSILDGSSFEMGQSAFQGSQNTRIQSMTENTSKNIFDYVNSSKPENSLFWFDIDENNQRASQNYERNLSQRGLFEEDLIKKFHSTTTLSNENAYIYEKSAPSGHSYREPILKDTETKGSEGKDYVHSSWVPEKSNFSLNAEFDKPNSTTKSTYLNETIGHELMWFNEPNHINHITNSGKFGWNDQILVYSGTTLDEIGLKTNGTNHSGDGQKEETGGDIFYSQTASEFFSRIKEFEPLHSNSEINIPDRQTIVETQNTIYQAIIKAIHQAAKDKSLSIRVSLEGGFVSSITIHVEEKEIKAVLNLTDKKFRKLIEDRQEELKQALKKRGYTLTDIIFVDSDTERQSFPSQNPVQILLTTSN
ncbi:MAG: hypothetical protein N2654_02620 [Deltaproteobacteria bacterium]|nr:hypothetical protein [Deltaproteobacteria bacterium]